MMNKPTIKQIFGAFLIVILLSILINLISDWVVSLIHTLLGLWELVKILEMPHKFYGLTIMLFISWKLLEAVIGLWLRGFEYAIGLIKNSEPKGEKNG